MSFFSKFLDLFKSLFRKKTQIQTPEYFRLYKRLTAQDVLMSLPYIGMWVKNKDFELLEISEQAAVLLYNRTYNECVGLTDYQIAKECGSTVSEEQFAHICRASDLYLKDDKPQTFLELVTDTTGKPHIWKTVKANISVEGEQFYFGFATFLDVMLGGYEAAYKKLQEELPLLEKLNDNLYIYK